MNKDITLIFVIYKSGEIFFQNIKQLSNFNKIIIDNDPNSNLELRIKKIDSTVDYTRLDKNIGMAKSANLAFNKVKTDFFLYITADTIIDEKKTDRSPLKKINKNEKEIIIKLIVKIILFIFFFKKKNKPTSIKKYFEIKLPNTSLSPKKLETLSGLYCQDPNEFLP